MKWQEVEGKLRAARFQIFTDREFRQVTGAGRVSAKFQLIRYTRRGLLVRLKRGLYAIKAWPPSRWAVANRLYRPSYISLASALSYYGLIPESVYGVTSVTAKSTREFEVEGVRYVFRALKPRAFTGYRSIELDGQPVLIAEKEKALADYLYFVFLKKEILNRRLHLTGVKRGKLRACLATFGNPRLLSWFAHDLKIPDRRAAR